MSDTSNTKLFEEGYEMAEEFNNHPSGMDKAIYLAIEDNDLENLKALISKCNAELSREHFYNHDAI